MFEADSPQNPEADPSATSVAANEENVVPESIEDQHEIPPDLQPSGPSYRGISTIGSVIQLSYIIAGNCLCSSVICICLWGFSKIEDLTLWQKRGFNAISLLLSGVLGFGIGFLLDRIGLLARGTILQSKSHSMKEVCPGINAMDYKWNN